MTETPILTNFSEQPCSSSEIAEDLLLLVQKPVRYIGGEINSVIKNIHHIKLHIAFAFPDVYEVGMSHLGLKILCSIVNSQEDLYAERVFAPWPDMESLLRKEHRPLVTLESGTPLSHLDFLGFSLQYELCATNVLQMLELGGIPLRAEDRTMDHPFVVGGGPVAFNPVPLSPFFDAFAIGDGEEAILELAHAQVQWKASGSAREDLLEQWKQVAGVFVPSLHEKGDIVHRRIVADLEKAHFPSRLIVPFCETVHDRVGLEIARGCTRGCRFCQAGMLYRPVREREPETILTLARNSIASTGWEEVALLSLSTGDYSHIGELIKIMAAEFTPGKVAISLPSLRTDTFDSEMAEHIRKVRKTGFTLAPEAGTDRLRRIINKGNTEEDLERAVTVAFRQGWTSIKLYFMIGLPFETDPDLDGMVGLIRKASKWAAGGRITASLSTFVPKSHTPFQWTKQISMEETRRRQQYIARYFQKRGVIVKFHDAKTSFLEGVLARGDSRLSNVIETVFKKGARFDGWADQLKFDLWMDTFGENQVYPHGYLEQKSMHDELTWDFIDTGVSREYLVREWEKALSEEMTADCRFNECTGCGVCDFSKVEPKLAAGSITEENRQSHLKTGSLELGIRRFRLCYAKLGRMRFLGHHDIVRVFHRAFRRAGLELDYSKGFHPHPKLRFSPPLGLGIESFAEFLDFELVHSGQMAEEIIRSLQIALPDGLKLVGLEERSLNEPQVSGKIQEVTYEINFSDSFSGEDAKRRVAEFSVSPHVEICSVRKGKPRRRDLKDWVSDLDVRGKVLRMTLKVGPEGSVHPWDAVLAILGLTRTDSVSLKMTKTSVQYDTFSVDNKGFSHVQ
jgi:radical SAM family uncharacterized protein/radical SAM-linked protein